MSKKITGALYAISLISWGVLLWNHFPKGMEILLFPALLGLGIAIILDVIILNNK